MNLTPIPPDLFTTLTDVFSAYEKQRFRDLNELATDTTDKQDAEVLTHVMVLTYIEGVCQMLVIGGFDITPTTAIGKVIQSFVNVHANGKWTCAGTETETEPV